MFGQFALGDQICGFGAGIVDDTYVAAGNLSEYVVEFGYERLLFPPVIGSGAADEFFGEPLQGLLAELIRSNLYEVLAVGIFRSFRFIHCVAVNVPCGSRCEVTRCDR